jgi:hypothetical protein
MKFRFVVSLFVCFVVFASNNARGYSAQLVKRIENLCAAIEKDLEKNPPPPERPHGEEDPRVSARYLTSTLRAALRSHQPGLLDTYLRELESGGALPENLRDAVSEVHSALRAEIEKEETAAIAQIEKKLADAGKAVRAATKPADLDRVLQTLTAPMDFSTDSASSKISAIRTRFDAARQLVIYWQDYLAAVALNDTKTAAQKLENAAGLKQDLIPRSEILERLGGYKKTAPAEPREQIAQVVSRTKTLDAIPAALDELAAFEQSNWEATHGTPDPSIAFFRQELASLANVYRQFMSGVPTTFKVTRNVNYPNSLAVTAAQELRVQLLRLIVPRVLGSAPEVAIQENETLQQYFDRMLAVARDRVDGRMIVKILEMQNTLRSDHPVDLSRLEALVAAQNQDEAGQFAAAVASYQSALKNGGELVPTRQIGERLAKIKAEHPNEYAAGMDIFVKNPPMFAGRNTYPTDAIEIPGATTR